ncbi:hypothetical protein EBU94_06110 [bacterium]|jgi:hypothetical protein|nr:hypothetical protein [bacterium]
MKRSKKINGKATKLKKPLTFGTVDFILKNAGKLTSKNIAAIIHRPIKTVQSVASRFKVSLKTL